ncbi:MAG: HlyD family efflux transporter periplasmic adaptor subunit [Planctomycetaceae bacterium]|nr:HlyD family efflux transporter periplasmic adaptor subunit [Planctomycetaceae bacterium]
MLRLAVVVVGLAVLGGIVWQIGFAPGVPVDVATAAVGPIEEYIEERARTAWPEVYPVTMPLDGRIQPFTLEVGDEVTAGQVVARMDAADLSTDRSAALAQLDQFRFLEKRAQNTLAAAQAQVKAAAAKLEYSSEEFARITKLISSKAVTESEAGQSRLLEIESRIELQQDSLTVEAIDAIQEAVLIAEQDAEEKLRQKERDLGRAEIRAEVDGVVVSRRVWGQQFLRAGDTLMELGQPRKLEVEAEILTQDAVRIPPGAAVQIFGPAVGDVPLPARVHKIYPQGFTKVSSLGVEQQRVRVIIHFDPTAYAAWQAAGRSLGADYRVRVRILTARSLRSLTVPRAALFRGVDGGWQVFVVRDEVARQVSLKLGLLNDQLAEVLEGLSEGDQVIIAPQSSLEDGTLVETQPVRPALTEPVPPIGGAGPASADPETAGSPATDG